MNSTSKCIGTIYFICLEFGPESELLAITQDWVSDLKKKGLEVIVVATHLRLDKKAHSNELIELGGGSAWQRLRALFRIFRLTVSILKKRNSCGVFYHMNHKVLATQGWFLKAFGVHQTLWYSHARYDKLLPIANLFADLIITTGSTAYPLAHKSIHPVGQAVNHDRFNRVNHVISSIGSSVEILSIGRISRSKRLEDFFMELKGHSNKKMISIHFYGPILDEKYAVELRQLARETNIKIEFHGPISYQKLSSVFHEYSFYFTGTDKAIDKAAVEAAMSGLIVMCKNMHFLQTIGLDNFYGITTNEDITINKQFEFLSAASGEKLTNMSMMTSRLARSNLSISNAINIYLKESKLCIER